MRANRELSKHLCLVCHGETWHQEIKLDVEKIYLNIFVCLSCCGIQIEKDNDKLTWTKEDFFLQMMEELDKR
jgi:hypothetical protein